MWTSYYELERFYHLAWLAMWAVWLLMIFAPHAKIAQRITKGPWTYLIPALLFMDISSSYAGSVIMWLHIETFNLYVARDVFRKGYAARMNPILVSIFILLIKISGPLGLMAYLGYKATVEGKLND